MLRVSENRRFLVRQDGRPFFYLGETGGNILYRLKREEIKIFLRNRAEKGFNVLHLYVGRWVSEQEPNAYGHPPFINADPTRPNEPFWEYVDYVVGEAARLGIHITMFLTWGDKVGPQASYGQGPIIFNAENGFAYGRWLGRRYRDAGNIIWVLGGDRAVQLDPLLYPHETDRRSVLPVWRTMAAGLKEGDGGRYLMTYHPGDDEPASKYLHREPWMDFNMIQTGHSKRNIAAYGQIEHDYLLEPPKPTLDGEICYEDAFVGWNPDNGWFDDYDVRKVSYWGVFAGGCGLTYGSMDIWGFPRPDAKALSNVSRRGWEDGMDTPGARQLKHLRALMESRPYLTRIPDQSLLASPVGAGADHMQATRDSDGSYAFIYMSRARPVAVNTDKLAGAELRAWWYDPRNGTAREIGVSAKEDTREFTPPLSGTYRDWVLVIDDVARNFAAPGEVSAA